MQKAAGAFMELKQSDSAKHSVNPPGNSRTRQGVLDQRDRDATVLAPDPAFSHAVSSVKHMVVPFHIMMDIINYMTS